MLFDINGRIKVKRAAANTSATAAGTGDNTQVTGVTIQRSAIGLPRSVTFAIPYTTTLASAATLSLAYIVETSANSNMASPTELTNVASAVIDTGGSGGSTNTGTVEIGVDLSGAKDYVRLKFTPDLSATGTDTAALAAVAVFGSFDELPA